MKRGWDLVYSVSFLTKYGRFLGYCCQRLLTVYQDKIHVWLEFLNITFYLLYILMKLLTGIGLNIAASINNSIKKAI